MRRYGQVIGFATSDIEAGDHVHTHNLAFGPATREYEFCADVRPVDDYPPEAMRYLRRLQARRTAGSARATTWPSSPR